MCEMTALGVFGNRSNIHLFISFHFDYLMMVYPVDCNRTYNCLFNIVVLEYTKLAQRVERVFIRAWKKYFPPSEVLENERIRQDEIKCVDMLGALDKRIRELLKVGNYVLLSDLLSLSVVDVLD